MNSVSVLVKDSAMNSVRVLKTAPWTVFVY